MKQLFLILIIISFQNFQGQNNSTIKLKNENFELKWLEPNTETSEVGKYDKLEFGLKMNSDIEVQINNFLKTNKKGINPFNPDDISVEFTFNSPSLKQRRIYGFYYQDFKREGEIWKEEQTYFNWRIRFAPDELGEWNFNVRIVAKDIIINEKGGKFNCVPSNSKGRLIKNNKGDNSDRYLLYSETKESFFAVGHNIAHSAYYHLTPEKAQQHQQWLTELAENGGNFFRLELGAPNGLPDWKKYDNYSKKMPQMWEFDQLVEHARHLGLYFILFRHHTELMKGESWDVACWENNPYKKGFNLKTRKEYFTNKDVIKWQKNALRYIFSRWGYNTSFAFYEYQELDHWYEELIKESGYNNEEAITFFKDWYIQQKNYIQTNLKYPILYINTYATTPDFEYDSKNDGMFANSDVIDFHKYGETKDINYIHRFDKAKELLNVWKKPVFVEEMGVSAFPGTNFLPIYKCSDIEFHNAIWATSFMGTAGSGLSWWWDRGVHDYNFCKEYNSLSAFLKNEKLSNEKFEPQKWHSKLSIKRALIENYALINNEKSRVIGWVHNASSYWRNVKSPCLDELFTNGKFNNPYKLKDGYIIGGEEKEKTDIKQKSDTYTKKGGVQDVANQTFVIKRLKGRQWYEVNFYSTQTNNIVATQEYRTKGSGKLKISYPKIQEGDFSYKIKYLDETKKASK